MLERLEELKDSTRNKNLAKPVMKLQHILIALRHIMQNQPDLSADANLLLSKWVRHVST